MEVDVETIEALAAAENWRDPADTFFPPHNAVEGTVENLTATGAIAGGVNALSDAVAGVVVPGAACRLFRRLKGFPGRARLAGRALLPSSSLFGGTDGISPGREAIEQIGTS